METGSISAADYEAAQATSVACLAQNGIELNLVKDATGVYDWSPYDTTKVSLNDEQLQAAQGRCMGLNDAIQQLHAIQQTNPGLYANQ